jgi:predicted nuclease with TOPRIM domain
LEIQHLKDQLITEQQTKETLENSLSGEIDDLREQLGLIRSVHTQLDEESVRKASLEVALQQAKEQLTDAQERAAESVLARVGLTRLAFFCGRIKKIIFVYLEQS